MIARFLIRITHLTPVRCTVLCCCVCVCVSVSQITTFARASGIGVQFGHHFCSYVQSAELMLMRQRHLLAPVNLDHMYRLENRCTAIDPARCNEEVESIPHSKTLGSHATVYQRM